MDLSIFVFLSLSAVSQKCFIKSTHVFYTFQSVNVLAGSDKTVVFGSWHWIVQIMGCERALVPTLHGENVLYKLEWNFANKYDRKSFVSHTQLHRSLNIMLVVLLKLQLHIKGIVNLKMKSLWSFTYPHVVQNPPYFLASVEHKRRCFSECSSCSFPFS